MSGSIFNHFIAKNFDGLKVLLRFVVDACTALVLVLRDIDNAKTVGHLKDEIFKKKPVAFEGVDADQLVLYEVCGIIQLSSSYAHKLSADTRRDQDRRESKR